MKNMMTERMVSDYAPYVKDPSRFKSDIARAVEEYGQVVDIAEEKYADGGIASRTYTFANGVTYKLDAARAGVESL